MSAALRTWKHAWRHSRPLKLAHSGGDPSRIASQSNIFANALCVAHAPPLDVNTARGTVYNRLPIRANAWSGEWIRSRAPEASPQGTHLHPPKTQSPSSSTKQLKTIFVETLPFSVKTAPESLASPHMLCCSFPFFYLGLFGQIDSRIDVDLFRCVSDAEGDIGLERTRGRC